MVVAAFIASLAVVGTSALVAAIRFFSGPKRVSLPPPPINVVAGVELPPSDDAGWELQGNSVAWNRKIFVDRHGKIQIEGHTLCLFDGFLFYRAIVEDVRDRERRRAIAALEEIRGAGAPYRRIAGGQS